MMSIEWQEASLHVEMLKECKVKCEAQQRALEHLGERPTIQGNGTGGFWWQWEINGNHVQQENHGKPSMILI